MIRIDFVLSQAFGLNDVMGCYIDLDQSIIKYTKNGKDLGTAFNIPGHMKKSHFFPAVVLKVRTERTKYKVIIHFHLHDQVFKQRLCCIRIIR